MKKLLIFTVSIILFINMFTSSVFASDVKITGEDTSCKPGDTVTVSFSISENSCIGAAGFDLLYNKDVFTFIEYDDGPAFSNGMPIGNDLGNGTFKYVFINADGIKKGGVMFSVTFEVSKDAKMGEKHPFTLVVDNLEKTTADPETKKVTNETIKLRNVISYVTIGNMTASVSSTPIEDVSSNVEQNSNDESFYHPILAVTSTDTDAESSGSNNTLLIITIILSVLAMALITTMVILIGKSYYNKKKEK